MSNQHPTEEGMDFEQPTEEAIEKRGFMSGPGRFVMFGGLVVVVLGGSVYYAFQQSGQQAPSEVADVPDMDMTPGGDVQAESEVYQDAIERDNIERADDAERTGQSFIPTPESIPQPTDVNEDRIAPGDTGGAQQVRPEDRVQQVAPQSVSISAPQAQESPEREQVAVAEPTRTRVPVAESRSARVATSDGGVGPQEPEEENPYVTLIAGQAQSVSQFTQRPIGSDTEVLRDPDQEEIDEEAMMAEAGMDANGDNPNSADNNDDHVEPLVRAGDILHAEMINSVSSDANTDVVAEITTGDYRGARLIGAFAVDESFSSLVVQFDRMIFEDGRTRDVTGLAVDGRTAEASVRTDVDRRLVGRYGPLMAASFVQGFGDSAAARAAEQTISGDNIVSSSPRATTRQSLAAGAASAAGAIAGDIEDRRVETPRVNLRRGHPLAILFIENVEE